MVENQGVKNRFRVRVRGECGRTLMSAERDKGQTQKTAVDRRQFSEFLSPSPSFSLSLASDREKVGLPAL